MSQYSHSHRYPFSNPLANALVVLVGALVVGASIVLGFFAFIFLGALILVLAAIVGIRVWWFNRKLRRQMGDGSATGSGGSKVHVEVIEGEYHVVQPGAQPDDRRGQDSET